MQTRQTETTLNEVLIRWDDTGALQGAHVVLLGKVLDENGKVLAAMPLAPMPIGIADQQGFSLSEVLTQLQIDSLKRIEFLEQQVESLNTTLAQVSVLHQEQIDQLLARE